ncbi:hypothetical protein VTJ49DRAFT_814 [Mycothermus thermophilus]|uniref:Aminoglycoside phosphotransferase domain-containing protein n=1 Tax=Humicola insolens TaxID=85995 RepID=A0ABR3VEB6_HUMIN
MDIGHLVYDDRQSELTSMAARAQHQPPLVPQLGLASEEGWLATSTDRKYYRRGNAFIKRCLRTREILPGPQGSPYPRLRKESLKNEADTLRFVRRHTEIPVPLLFCDFEDDDAYYLITEYVEGVSMAELPDEQKQVVTEELESYLAQLKTLRSNRLGGPTGIVIPPYRVLCETERDDWSRLRTADRPEYVFCHNDCSQHNVIVNPDTLKIAAIVDWEYAGFYPEWFEFPFYTRKGPSVALGDEEDDASRLLDFLNSQREPDPWEDSMELFDLPVGVYLLDLLDKSPQFFVFALVLVLALILTITFAIAFTIALSLSLSLSITVSLTFSLSNLRFTSLLLLFTFTLTFTLDFTLTITLASTLTITLSLTLSVLLTRFFLILTTLPVITRLTLRQLLKPQNRPRLPRHNLANILHREQPVRVPNRALLELALRGIAEAAAEVGVYHGCVA